MSDTQQNNPAGRVLAILTKVKETQARTVADGFASVFGIDVTDNYGGLYRCLGSLGDSVNSIEERLEQTGNTHFVPYFKKRLPSLRRIFTFQGPALAWDAFKQTFIHEPDLATLEGCSTAIANSLPERTFSPTDLSELQKKIESLYQEVLSSRLEKELKITVLSCLEQLLSAIRDYNILGARPIVSAVNNAMACAINTANVDTADPSTMDKFRATVDYAANLANASPSEMVRILKQIESGLKNDAAPSKGLLTGNASVTPDS